MPKFAATTDNRYVFEIFRHTQPKEISNLWTLKVITPTESEPITICNADSLSTCIAKIGLIFEQDGL